MYQRTYPPNETLPPNYKGNAFDNSPAVLQEESERERDSCSQCESCEKCEKKEKKEDTINSIFSRRNGSSFALDDIILGGLIVLLLNNHADDELLLVLVLLFISGI